MKTVLITGCSSGFGLETAKFFLERNWKVVATMRTPQPDLLPRSEHLRVLRLDVTKTESIREVVEAAGPIDVLVNNAGIGLLGTVESTPMQTMRDIVETNTFGVFGMTQAVLPQFRARKSGVIVNVTSSVTLKPLPLLAVYTSSKAAVEAFTECLALELRPFGIRVGIVQPGSGPDTRFSAKAKGLLDGLIPEAYSDFAKGVFAGMATRTVVTRSADVAEAVWQAATDASAPMHIAAGDDAKALVATMAA
jgi:NAD(P)-dependent dehydrogenase (short-subunit alcohol dehydrogenase family)